MKKVLLTALVALGLVASFSGCSKKEAPVEANTTVAPVEANTTVAPVEANTTVAPVEANTTVK